VLFDERIHTAPQTRGKLDVRGGLLSRQQLEIGHVVERLKAGPPCRTKSPSIQGSLQRAAGL
jgi:hypothetical protein